MKRKYCTNIFENLQLLLFILVICQQKYWKRTFDEEIVAIDNKQQNIYISEIGHSMEPSSILNGP